ncbi:MAG: hypothetical protein NPIRA05_05050 [Nitrospirales bacterium]|nr:MAG: hypothetical protein NPIRA05_05050 [Nitrospirales bacterium]
MRVPGVSRIRHRANSLRKRYFPGNGVILMYHRVTEKQIDPWKMCVTPQNFVSHLDVLRSNYYPMTLSDFIRSHREKSLPERSVAVTFDDGYSDNYHSALPALIEYGIPATFFISTMTSRPDEPFWWDVLQSIFLVPGILPDKLRLQAGNSMRVWETGSAKCYSEEDYLSGMEELTYPSIEGSRMHLYLSVWDALRKLTDKERSLRLGEIKNWAFNERSDSSQLSCPARLSHDEIKDMVQSPLFDIGAHTVTHPSLPTQDESTQRLEIEQSKSYLESICGQRVSHFAYPFGDYSKETVKFVRDAGFESACTTNESDIWRFTDCYQLPRVAAPDCGLAQFDRTVQRFFSE